MATGITYDLRFEEWEAASSYNLESLWKWYTGQYPVNFKAMVIAFHRLHKSIENHVGDALNADLDRKK